MRIRKDNIVEVEPQTKEFHSQVSASKYKDDAIRSESIYNKTIININLQIGSDNVDQIPQLVQMMQSGKSWANS